MTKNFSAAVPWFWPGSTVARFIDGDTFVGHLTKDIGFHGAVTFEQRLRLARINAPALSTPEGKAAVQFFVALVAEFVLVDITTMKPYKYGDEWMAEVLTTAPVPVNVSDAMVAAGHAVHWDGKGPRPGG